MLPTWTRPDPLAKRWKLRYDDFVAIVYLSSNQGYRWKIKDGGSLISRSDRSYNSSTTAIDAAESALVSEYNRMLGELDTKFTKW